MAGNKLDARGGALALLAAARQGATLDEAASAITALAPAERARAQRLAAAVLRLRGRADAVLAPLLARRPRPEVGDLLRLGVTEMLAFDAPAHGVVNAAVALARSQGGRGQAAAGMVNAVLRRAADGAGRWQAAAPTRLPDWLRGRLRAAWGDAATLAIEAAHEVAPPLDLTPAPGHDPAPLIAAGAVLLPTGTLRLAAGAQVSALPGYAEGGFWVQDAAAALPARLLDPRPGEAVADLCAAPGGKTLQLAAAGARVTALDISAPRMARVAENLARCRLEAETVVADARDWRPPAPLDAVLLDAPCSATGTIRRHPELPLIRDAAALPGLIALQAALIDHALDVLRPGGRLVFATCSLLPEEGEAQVAAALARHPGLTAVPPPADLPGSRSPEGGLRLRPDLWPEAGGMDGFYIACLRRPGAAA